MKYFKGILLFSIAMVNGILIIELFKLFHEILVFIVRKMEIGYLINIGYILGLSILGIYLLRFMSGVNVFANWRKSLISSAATGIGIGLIFTALIETIILIT